MLIKIKVSSLKCFFQIYVFYVEYFYKDCIVLYISNNITYLIDIKNLTIIRFRTPWIERRRYAYGLIGKQSSDTNRVSNRDYRLKENIS